MADAGQPPSPPVLDPGQLMALLDLEWWCCFSSGGNAHAAAAAAYLDDAVAAIGTAGGIRATRMADLLPLIQAAMAGDLTAAQTARLAIIAARRQDAAPIPALPVQLPWQVALLANAFHGYGYSYCLKQGDAAAATTPQAAAAPPAAAQPEAGHGAAQEAGRSPATPKRAAALAAGQAIAQQMAAELGGAAEGFGGAPRSPAAPTWRFLAAAAAGPAAGSQPPEAEVRACASPVTPKRKRADSGEGGSSRMLQASKAAAQGTGHSPLRLAPPPAALIAEAAPAPSAAPAPAGAPVFSAAAAAAAATEPAPAADSALVPAPVPSAVPEPPIAGSMMLPPSAPVPAAPPAAEPPAVLRPEDRGALQRLAALAAGAAARARASAPPQAAPVPAPVPAPAANLAPVPAPVPSTVPAPPIAGSMMLPPPAPVPAAPPAAWPPAVLRPEDRGALQRLSALAAGAAARAARASAQPQAAPVPAPPPAPETNPAPLPAPAPRMGGMMPPPASAAPQPAPARVPVAPPAFQVKAPLSMRQAGRLLMAALAKGAAAGAAASTAGAQGPAPPPLGPLRSPPARSPAAAAASSGSGASSKAATGALAAARRPASPAAAGADQLRCLCDQTAMEQLLVWLRTRHLRLFKELMPAPAYSERSVTLRSEAHAREVLGRLLPGLQLAPQPAKPLVSEGLRRSAAVQVDERGGRAYFTVGLDLWIYSASLCTRSQDGAVLHATGHGISRQLGLASACRAIAARLPDFWELGGGAGGSGGA
ncbi:hypothetical protein Rsub_06514 [Raphidocelis subcapitata]|uniref:Uncharacterized protein n=1 Tax=Raphidocelis subcapitata TaxID=307507 RepID=A0A2V0P2Z5_9CHLO|nr:hypothetical protein Rsub_06514 [Raphidocelis subcapitata]|eukprot:GBF94244.1 hypothetical protein Rsub_06514 [Raphidocelis subcapitata]